MKQKNHSAATAAAKGKGSKPNTPSKHKAGNKDLSKKSKKAANHKKKAHEDHDEDDDDEEVDIMDEDFGSMKQ